MSDLEKSLNKKQSLGRCRLDRFIGQKLNISRRDVRLMLAQNRIEVDGLIAKNIEQIVDRFSNIIVDGKVVQENQAYYIMLHKPVGVVSATSDTKHKTVIDLLDFPDKNQLHIVGRLDLNTSGLLLLTNDSRWSEHLTSPENKVEKVYQVTLQNPLTDEYISAFNEGMYFGYEDITTRPAKLKILSEFVAEVTLTEGRYHQIKRMFGRFRNPVVKLHRSRVGAIQLDDALKPSDYRMLSTSEISFDK